jgi:hypothetical protein
LSVPIKLTLELNPFSMLPLESDNCGRSSRYFIGSDRIISQFFLNLELNLDRIIGFDAEFKIARVIDRTNNI